MVVMIVLVMGMAGVFGVSCSVKISFTLSVTHWRFVLWLLPSPSPSSSLSRTRFDIFPQEKCTLRTWEIYCLLCVRVRLVRVANARREERTKTKNKHRYFYFDSFRTTTHTHTRARMHLASIGGNVRHIQRIAENVSGFTYVQMKPPICQFVR